MAGRRPAADPLSLGTQSVSPSDAYQRALARQRATSSPFVQATGFMRAALANVLNPSVSAVATCSRCGGPALWQYMFAAQPGRQEAQNMRPSESFGLQLVISPLLRRFAPSLQAALSARRLGPGRVLSMQREGQSLTATMRAPSGAHDRSTLAERAERAVLSTGRPLGGLARSKVCTAHALHLLFWLHAVRVLVHDARLRAACGRLATLSGCCAAAMLGPLSRRVFCWASGGCAGGAVGCAREV